MAAKIWTLTDPHQAGGATVLKTLGPKDIGGSGGWSIASGAYHVGLNKGVEFVDLNTGAMTVRVLPTRGMGVWDATVGGERIGWKSPVRGPVEPRYVDLGEPSGLGWLDGFDELLCRCGLVSNGAPDFDPKTNQLLYPVHGRIANRPAHHVEVAVDPEKEELRVTGIVEETRFHFTKLRMTSTLTAKFNSTAFTIHDEVENFSASAGEMQMLYHVNFGLPLLDAGSRVVLPVKTLVPRNDHAASGVPSWDSYAAPMPGTEEMVYFFELLGDAEGQTRTLLKNAHGTRGVSLVYNTKQLPCFSLWKNTTAEADGYVTGLEPGTNFPNPRTHEGKEGRVVKLPPGGKYAMDLTIEIHPTDAAVKAAEAAVAKIRAGREPKIFDKPQKGWCA